MNPEARIEPTFPDLSSWQTTLEAVASQPLEFLPDFPRVAARHEDWWRCELKGPPLVLTSASRDPSVPGGRRLDLLTRPAEWMAARLAQLAQTALVADALPAIRVDFGPVCLGMLIGAPFDFVSDTTWTRHFIQDDWANAPDWQIHADNPWWQVLRQLLRLNAENAQGRYLAMTPSLGGSADLLLNTRGPERLCLDSIDQPEKIRAAIAAIDHSWRRGYETIWDTTCARGAGALNWVGLWSNRPYHVLECDFNYLIGPTTFEDLFLPDIRRQAAAVGRSIFHLDGPGAAKHCDILLDSPEISAIQYITGAGHSALKKLDMLKRIQKRGKPLQVSVENSQEALELSRQLDPGGLCLLLSLDLDPPSLEAFYRELARPFG